jgi:hypothetical protein
MGATFAAVKTWIAGETLTASDLNAEFNNILNNLDPTGIDDESANDAAAQATSDPYPGSSLSKATSLETEIQQLRHLIAQITGETYWYIDPDNSIATLEAWKTIIENSRLGSLNRSIFTYNGGATAYTIKCKAASYYVKDKYAHWVTELTTGAIGTPGASDWYYLYLDYSAITSGTAITNSELIWSNTEPAWSDTYMGWYNGDDRCIFAARTNAAPTNILEFYHDGNDILYADEITDFALANITTNWSDKVTLTVPSFVRRANVTFHYRYVDASNVVASWRTEGQTATTGHTIGSVSSGKDERIYTERNVICSSNLKIDIKDSATATNTMRVTTNGWFFPLGM